MRPFLNTSLLFFAHQLNIFGNSYYWNCHTILPRWLRYEYEKKTHQNSGKNDHCLKINLKSWKLCATPSRVRLYLGIYAHVYIDVHIQIEFYTAQNVGGANTAATLVYWFWLFVFFCHILFNMRIFWEFIWSVHFSLVLQHWKKMFQAICWRVACCAVNK